MAWNRAEARHPEARSKSSIQRKSLQIPDSQNTSPGTADSSFWQTPARGSLSPHQDVAIVFDTPNRYPRSPLVASLTRPLLERFWLRDSGFSILASRFWPRDSGF